MGKINLILGGKILSLGGFLYFFLFVTLIFITFSPFKQVNTIVCLISIICNFIYALIISFKIVIYKVKN